MAHTLKAFEVDVNGKVLDYRTAGVVDFPAVQRFFWKKYIVNKLWSGGRHVLGELEKDGRKYFLKLATTEGISAVLKNEYHWNEGFHRAVPQGTSEFRVPKNLEHGLFEERLYFLITDMFDGTLLVGKPDASVDMSVFTDTIESVVKFSEFIQTLPFHDATETGDYRERFLLKVHAWYDLIPQDVRGKYELPALLHIVEKGAAGLKKKPRHGDFTPWHLMMLSDGKLGLIDGEHYMAAGVAYYDIGYFIQRIYSVLSKPEIAVATYAMLMESGYDAKALQVILASRAIGGFLDASFAEKPDYTMHDAFKVWVVNPKVG